MSEMNHNKQESQDKVELTNDQRIKVLSPGMLVMKRFMRNKLAIIGTFIIIAMFLFAFVGGMLSPYGESEVFRITEEVVKDYAGVTYNKEFQYTVAEGADFPSSAGSKLILATNKEESSFESNGFTYNLIEEGEDFYQVVGLQEIATALTLKGKTVIKVEDGQTLSDAAEKAATVAIQAKEASFEADGILFTLVQQGREMKIAVSSEIALASKMVFSPYVEGDVFSYNFKLEAQKAMESGSSTFLVDGEEYQLEIDAETESALIKADGEEYGFISHYSTNAVASDAFLSVEFRKKIEKAIADDSESFVFPDNQGTPVDYIIERENNNYMIRTEQSTQLNDIYASPSKEHWLGTDGNGMDILTRLMHGGRISLMIGFVAISIQLVIGVLVGGIAGYFGGWTDNILMRFVDVVNCIPVMPLYIIMGAIMDYYELDPRVRIYMLCVILGLFSWPTIARMVRGQILSLREQEFMIATEATGVRVSRRIFKHLVPNVIPQLIVIATMGLGSIIITEATLSFLGLGVKFPYASWGNIVNAVNDIYVLTNHWFVWIPAGFLILFTVLGFNFIGDGLRDAFDPKMKR